MTIYTWSGFKKKRNSTKIPTDAGSSYTVNIKEPTSVDNPRFVITSSDFGISYVQAWGNYYFVTNIVSITETVLELHCEKDVLATYKTDIGNYTAFVSRSASSYDITLHDGEISQAQEYIQEAEGARTTILAGAAQPGAYVIRVVGYSGVNSFLATKSQINALLNYAFDQNNYDTGGSWVDFFGDTIAAAFCNPFQFIVDVRWIALSASMVTTLSALPTDRVYLGYFDTNIDLPVLDPSAANPTPLLFDTYVPAIPSEYYNDFRDYDASWAKYDVYIPGCGNYAVDPVAVQNGISVDHGIDTLTGEVIAQVYSGTSDPGRTLLFETRGTAGVPIQVGQVTSNGGSSFGLANVLKTPLEIGKSLISKFNILAQDNDVPYVPTSTIAALCGDQASVVGSVGSMGCVQLNPDLFVTKRILKAKDLRTNTLGRPLCQNVQISNLSGYVLCADASVDIAGESGDKSAVNSFLNGGFYYE